MRKSLERVIEEKIKLEAMIVDILDDAAYAERFITKPNNKRCPSMYKILDYCYEKKKTLVTMINLNLFCVQHQDR